MDERVPALIASHDIYKSSKDKILSQWLSYKSVQNILKNHDIDAEYFKIKYAGGVFDYFMGVMAGEVEIGNCPIMQNLLAYLKNREISADELFEICIHFRMSMVDFSYDAKLNSKELFDEISYIFDENFRGILKYYTDTIFQKLIDARQEAIKASQAKEYFLSNMSHEIRTPLNAILGFVKLLMGEDLSLKQKKYLSTILESSENLLNIINDILDFSKLRSGEFTIEAKSFCVHEDMTHTIELFAASAGAKNITLGAYIDPLMPKEVYGDSLRIRQILSNFLSNAIKFTPNGGLIDVEISYDASNLKINVSDNGIGIKEDDLKNIFSAFVQAQHTQNNTFDGTGLGLSICYQLAKHMNGDIGVDSIYGLGSKFYVSIPVKVEDESNLLESEFNKFSKLKVAMYKSKSKNRYKENLFLKYADTLKLDVVLVESFENNFDIGVLLDECVNREFVEQLALSSKKYIILGNNIDELYEEYENIFYLSPPLHSLKIKDGFEELLYPSQNKKYTDGVDTKFKGHILVAEDNEANQELIKILLGKYGLSFDLAKNGLEALQLYKLNSYDLILMDEQMPVMDGNEALKQILEYEKLRSLEHTPVSALTANVVKDAMQKGLQSGYDSFLGKPIILKDLQKVFMKYLKKDESAPKEQNNTEIKTAILGLDVKKLQEELMLNEDELIMLVSLYIKKMQKQIPQLKDAIEKRDYKKIALYAHSIKGSSGNFRVEFLQNSASEMEKMAKAQNKDYNYEIVFQNIKNRVEEIKIL